MAAHVRMLGGLAAILLVLVAPSAGSADTHGAMAPATQLQTELLDQVNTLRTGHGLARLRLSPALTAAANAHSSEMARLGYFSHNSANGASFFSRSGGSTPSAASTAGPVGENLLWGAPDVGALRAFKLWLSSAASQGEPALAALARDRHRRNALDECPRHVRRQTDDGRHRGLRRAQQVAALPRYPFAPGRL